MRGVLSCATEASTARSCASAVKLLFPRDGGGVLYLYNYKRLRTFIVNSLLCRAPRVPPRSSPLPAEWRFGACEVEIEQNILGFMRT